MAEVTRAAKVAAALERWRIETEPGAGMPSMPSVKGAGDALAALLREPQPEPVYTDDTPLMLEYREADEPAPVGGEDDVELIRVARGAALNPVVGRSVRNLLEDLATRLEAALADVARLQKELRVEKDYTESAYLAAREAGEACGKARDEANEARAALAAAVAEREAMEGVTRAAVERALRLHPDMRIDPVYNEAAIAAIELKIGLAATGIIAACEVDVSRARAGRNDAG